MTKAGLLMDSRASAPSLRHLAKRWLPPALTEFLRDMRMRRDIRVNFRTFWAGFAHSSLPPELSDMVTAFVESPDFEKVSRYWHYLNATNVKMIARSVIHPH
jgi:hypothetical protein